LLPQSAMPQHLIPDYDHRALGRGRMGSFVLLCALSGFLIAVWLGYVIGWQTCEMANSKQLRTAVQELEKMRLDLAQATAGRAPYSSSVFEP